MYKLIANAVGVAAHGDPKHIQFAGRCGQRPLQISKSIIWYKLQFI
ncbi:MAG: hypothetical protein IJB90_00345 [Clostridia bacterium]|nr:hypothetical protein [Clostridia bacterium]